MSEALAIGTLVFSLGMGVPQGWIEVKKDLCEKSYGQNFDGRIVTNGSTQLIIPKCLMKVSP